MQMTLLPLVRAGRWPALAKSHEDRTRFARDAYIKEFLIKVRLLNALIQNKKGRIRTRGGIRMRPTGGMRRKLGHKEPVSATFLYQYALALG